MESIYNTDESTLSLPRARQATVDSIFQYLLEERWERQPKEVTLSFDDLENACREEKWKSTLKLHFKASERINIATFREFHKIIGKNVEEDEDFIQIAHNM